MTTKAIRLVSRLLAIGLFRTVASSQQSAPDPIPVPTPVPAAAAPTPAPVAEDQEAALMLDNGDYACSKCDYDKAMTCYLRAAERGSSVAMNNIGDLYALSPLSTKFGWDHNAYVYAMQWYQKAAKLWNVAAMRNIGRLYFTGGEGINQDYARAIVWFLKAAGRGNADAMEDLGYSYRMGIGVEKNIVTALYWYQRALDAGHKQAAESIKAIRDGDE